MVPNRSALAATGSGHGFCLVLREGGIEAIEHSDEDSDVRATQLCFFGKNDGASQTTASSPRASTPNVQNSLLPRLATAGVIWASAQTSQSVGVAGAVVGDGSGFVHVLQIASPHVTLVQSWKAHHAAVTALAVVPGSSGGVIVCCEDGTASLWSLTGQLRNSAIVRSSAPILDVQVSNDFEKVAFAHGEHVTVLPWPLDRTVSSDYGSTLAGPRCWKVPVNSSSSDSKTLDVTAVSWSPCSSKLAVGTDNGSVFLYSHTGELLHKCDETGRDCAIETLAWSYDGSVLLVCAFSAVVALSEIGELRWDSDASNLTELETHGSDMPAFHVSSICDEFARFPIESWGCTAVSLTQNLVHLFGKHHAGFVKLPVPGAFCLQGQTKASIRDTNAGILSTHRQRIGERMTNVDLRDDLVLKDQSAAPQFDRSETLSLNGACTALGAHGNLVIAATSHGEVHFVEVASRENHSETASSLVHSHRTIKMQGRVRDIRVTGSFQNGRWSNQLVVFVVDHALHGTANRNFSAPLESALQRSVQVYSFDGRHRSSLQVPCEWNVLASPVFDKRMLSCSSDVIALMSPADSHVLLFFDTVSGQQISQCRIEQSTWREVTLSQCCLLSGRRQAAAITEGGALYLLDVGLLAAHAGKRGMQLVESKVSHAMWHPEAEVLLAIKADDSAHVLLECILCPRVFFQSSLPTGTKRGVRLQQQLRSSVAGFSSAMLKSDATATVAPVLVRAAKNLIEWKQHRCDATVFTACLPELSNVACLQHLIGTQDWQAASNLCFVTSNGKSTAQVAATTPLWHVLLAYATEFKQQNIVRTALSKARCFAEMLLLQETQAELQALRNSPDAARAVMSNTRGERSVSTAESERVLLQMQDDETFDSFGWLAVRARVRAGDWRRALQLARHVSENSRDCAPELEKYVLLRRAAWLAAVNQGEHDEVLREACERMKMTDVSSDDNSVDSDGFSKNVFGTASGGGNANGSNWTDYAAASQRKWQQHLAQKLNNENEEEMAAALENSEGLALSLDGVSAWFAQVLNNDKGSTLTRFEMLPSQSPARRNVAVVPVQRNYAPRQRESPVVKAAHADDIFAAIVSEPSSQEQQNQSKTEEGFAPLQKSAPRQRDLSIGRTKDDAFDIFDFGENDDNDSSDQVKVDSPQPQGGVHGSRSQSQSMASWMRE
ncbi:MAG: hypothetical protein MHM6MM_004145 [Cercozoa sp. M6MM]